MNAKRVAVLGSTGSIGRQTLEVISEQAGLQACALGAGSNWRLLAEQARAYRPAAVAIADAGPAKALRQALPESVELLTGPSSMVELVRRTRPDLVLAGMVGAAGLAPALAAIECGSALAIANKETLVMAGAILMPAARRAGTPVLPVDSEHSAILQCLAAGRRDEVRRVTLTASGGALRHLDEPSAAEATVAQALNHPTWNMGPKITIDSATMVNKALELVEAHWLFGLAPEQMEVVLHPESIVHSTVEFCDGSILAQLGPPDMKMPIAFALCHPDRPTRHAEPLRLWEVGKLTFRPLERRFARAVQLGFDAIRRGGTAGAVLNSANEAAVASFLDGRISFGQIVPLVEEVLARTPAPSAARPLLEELQEADAWARRQVEQEVQASRAGTP